MNRTLLNLLRLLLLLQQSSLFRKSSTEEHSFSSPSQLTCVSLIVHTIFVELIQTNSIACGCPISTPLMIISSLILLLVSLWLLLFQVVDVVRTRCSVASQRLQRRWPFRSSNPSGMDQSFNSGIRSLSLSSSTPSARVSARWVGREWEARRDKVALYYLFKEEGGGGPGVLLIHLDQIKISLSFSTH